MDALIVDPDGVYVDVTFGGGGHSKEILNRLTAKGRLFGFDQDEQAIANVIEQQSDSWGRRQDRIANLVG